MVKAILALIQSLPELIKLMKKIEAKNKEANIKRKVKEDIQVLNKALEEGDSEAVRRLFNS